MEKRENERAEGRIGRWWSELETWEGSRRTFLSQLWVGGGILTERLKKIKQDTGYFSIVSKNYWHIMTEWGKKEIFGRENRPVNERTSRLHSPVMQPLNRSSLVVNLALPLPLSYFSKMATAAEEEVVLGPILEHTFFLDRQVVGLFNKYRIWLREKAEKGGVKGHRRL